MFVCILENIGRDIILTTTRKLVEIWIFFFFTNWWVERCWCYLTTVVVHLRSEEWFQHYRRISICTEHALDYNGRHFFFKNTKGELLNTKFCWRNWSVWQQMVSETWHNMTWQDVTLIVWHCNGAGWAAVQTVRVRAVWSYGNSHFPEGLYIVSCYRPSTFYSKFYFLKYNRPSPISDVLRRHWVGILRFALSYCSSMVNPWQFMILCQEEWNMHILHENPYLITVSSTANGFENCFFVQI
jgi:hypothetical protein